METVALSLCGGLNHLTYDCGQRPWDTAEPCAGHQRLEVDDGSEGSRVRGEAVSTAAGCPHGVNGLRFSSGRNVSSPVQFPVERSLQVANTLAHH